MRGSLGVDLPPALTSFQRCVALQSRSYSHNTALTAFPFLLRLCHHISNIRIRRRRKSRKGSYESNHVRVELVGNTPQNLFSRILRLLSSCKQEEAERREKRAGRFNIQAAEQSYAPAPGCEPYLEDAGKMQARAARFGVEWKPAEPGSIVDAVAGQDKRGVFFFFFSQSHQAGSILLLLSAAVC